MKAMIAKRFTLHTGEGTNDLEVELVFSGEVDSNGIVVYDQLADALWRPVHVHGFPKLEWTSLPIITAWIWVQLTKAPMPGASDLLTCVRVRLKSDVVRATLSSEMWCAMWRDDLSVDDIDRFHLAG